MSRSDHEFNGHSAEPDHWSERGRATSVANSDALGRPRRSVLSFGGVRPGSLRCPIDVRTSINTVKGFTLLEMLMVVTVTAALAALLLPVLVRVKAQAKRSVCMNNLRQIGFGVRMYADDSSDAFPPATNLPPAAFTDYTQLRVTPPAHRTPNSRPASQSDSPCSGSFRMAVAFDTLNHANSSRYRNA